jgi:hypothetical protein
MREAKRTRSWGFKMTDWKMWRRKLVIAMGSRCQYVDPETGEQCGETDADELELHHITDAPLGNKCDRHIEVRKFMETGRLPEGEELRCGDHHKLETAIQMGDEVAAARWRVKLRQKRAQIDERS